MNSLLAARSKLDDLLNSQVWKQSKTTLGPSHDTSGGNQENNEESSKKDRQHEMEATVNNSSAYTMMSNPGTVLRIN